ncbi:MAG: sigma-70 family RNA polymerase sigma factor [Phycisphaerales bacterium]|nr:sigma-70 family RNA polymerase sigma factor [Phycisphaerales bacterium]
MEQPARVYRPLTDAQQRLLDQLVSDCAARVAGYIRRFHGRRFDAADLTAETFARAAANIGALSACEQPVVYLLAIARNLCRDGVRRKSPGVLTEAAADELTAASEDPASAALRREREDELRAAVDALPEAFREVVILRMTAGLSFEEIAGTLNIPLGTALSRMHTAIQRLRKALGEREQSERSVAQSDSRERRR